MGKNTPQRRIDVPRGGDGARDAEIQASQGGAILGAPVVDTPTDLTWVTTYVDISDYTPLAVVEVSWRYDSAAPPDVFLVQWSTSPTFADPTTVAIVGTTAALRGLPTETVLYIRVAARRAGVVSPWSPSITGTTAADVSSLAAVTGAAAVWNISTGDVTITWTPPADRRYKHTVVTVQNASTSAVLRTATATAGQYVWTFAQQVQDTGGSFVYSVNIKLQPVTTRGIVGPITQLTVSAPPLSAPTGVTTSWAGDTGVAEADCLITWNHVTGAVYYDVAVNGVSRSVGYVNRYLYTYEQNRRENGGNGDPTLLLTVTARDVYNRSASTSISATNAAPPAPTAPTTTAFFSSCRFSWPAITARDAHRIVLTVQRDGVDTLTVSLSPQTTEYLFEASQSGVFRARLVTVDVFEQASAASAWSGAATLTDTIQFVQALRAGVTYRDSAGTSPSALNALKDADTLSGGVTYSPSPDWRWIEARYDREIRHRTTTLCIASTGMSAYLGLSLDGATWTWYTGGTVSGNVWSPVQQTSESSAQSNATSLPVGQYRVQLPFPVQTRYVRLGFRATVTSVTVREFYPRSLVQGDDIEAETIRGIHIAASSITADRLSVGSLSAISANLGSVTAGSITGVTINGVTITGTTISGSTITGTTFYTSSTPPRIEMDAQGIRYRAADNTTPFYVSISSSGGYDAGNVWTNTLYTDAIRLGLNVTLKDFGNFGSGALLYLGNIPSSYTQCGLYVDDYGVITGVIWELGEVALKRGERGVRVDSSSVAITANNVSVLGDVAGRTAFHIAANSSDVADIVFTRASTPNSIGALRFLIQLDSADNFSVGSRNDDGSPRHIIFYVHRLNGHIGFGGVPSVSNGGVGSIDIYGDARIRGTLRAKTDWTSITLENNWQDCGSLTGDPSVAYRVMPDGTVQFRGAIRRTSGTSMRLFTMPTALQGSVARRVVVSYRVNGTSMFSATQLAYYPWQSHGVFFDGPQITNSTGTTVEGIVSLWMSWNLLS